MEGSEGRSLTAKNPKSAKKRERGEETGSWRGAFMGKGGDPLGKKMNWQKDGRPDAWRAGGLGENIQLSTEEGEGGGEG